MTLKSKESGQKENIKLGIVAVFAMIVLVSTVLIVIESTTSYQGQAVIKYGPVSNFKGRCMPAVPNLKLTQQECMNDGYNQCRIQNPLWEYPTSTVDICYKECMFDIRNKCSWANSKYPNYKL